MRTDNELRSALRFELKVSISLLRFPESESMSELSDVLSCRISADKLSVFYTKTSIQ